MHPNTSSPSSPSSPGLENAMFGGDGGGTWPAPRVVTRSSPGLYQAVGDRTLVTMVTIYFPPRPRAQDVPGLSPTAENTAIRRLADRLPSPYQSSPAAALSPRRALPPR